MLLSIAQKNSIKKRANNGETGSSLAREFGVSNSTISNIKNHYVPEVVVQEETSAKQFIASKVKTIPLRTVVINSNKFIGETFRVKATTLGELLLEIKESGAVKAVFKDATNSRKVLERSTDKLPDTNGEPLYLYLAPIKTDAGK